MHKNDYGFLQSRHKHHKRHQNEEFDEELNTLFNKKFRFRFDSDWKLPPADAWFSAPPWKVKELETLKSRLNFHKSQLNDFDIEEWSSHTRRRNPSGEVCWKIRCLVNPEFLTQAWTKFYECACSYRIIPSEAVISRKMVSLHLCEAPGAFITSLNHYLKQNYEEIEWKWLANTLNPYYEGNSPGNMISDDRFMLHTLQHWHFGTDNTGNLMDWTNSRAIVKDANKLGKVLLATADGSIDCVQKPDAQEEATSPLHYCETVTALQALSPGGTFVFKLFTTFEHSTVGLLYLLNHLFGEVNIYKPVTSRQGNSEVYAICLQYKGSDQLEEYLPKLKSAYGTNLYSDKSLFSLENIPETFIKQVEECAYYFSSLQCQVINNNLQAYLMQNSIPFAIDVKKLRSVVAAEFIRQYDLRPLDYEQEVLKGVLHEENKVNTNPRYHRGSYTERQLYAKMTLKEKCKSLSGFLQTDILNLLIFIKETIRWKSFYDKDVEIDTVFTYGLPLKKVNSSKFIFVPIFKLYQQILAEEEFVSTIQSKSNETKELDVMGEKLLLPDLENGESYNEYEKRCFLILLVAVRNLSLGESLILTNFATLTHFNISVLYVLTKKCFEKTGFSSDAIILSNMLNKEGLQILKNVENECVNGRECGTGTQDVWNFLPVQLTNVGEFFGSIVLYNNTFYRNRCVEYLDLLEQTLYNNEQL
ncbi:cap-specific mRNA (nucleoside-2'-O-)-methyltransferase 2 [Cydia splendana]|uniref:cap-specific mRNA (nucleoside-2'-O-)-methyltransferase 2 n=1 Tax=Cydia splendana TaxID=1100963 RepID=UPI0021415716